MSDIIHDDHQNMWVPINQSDLNIWLTDLDMCMLQVNSSDTDLREYQQKNCNGLPSAGSASQKLFCHVGSSLGKQCSPPLNTRTFFKSRLKDKRIGDPTDGYLNKALRQLAKLKKSVLFLGDGISKQNQDALVCELMRTENITLLGTMRDEYRQLFHNLTIIWPQTLERAPLQLDIIFMKMNKILEREYIGESSDGEEDDAEINKYTDSQSRRERRKRQRRQLLTSNKTILSNLTRANGTMDRTLNVHDVSYGSKIDPFVHNGNGDDSSGGLDDSDIADPNSTEYVNQGSRSINTVETTRRHGFSLVDVKAEVDNMQSLYSGMVIIANTGVWYNSRERFRDEVPKFLTWLNQLGKNSRNLVFYRETSAQHWNFSEVGYFESEWQVREEAATNGSCTPIYDSSPDYDWRNKDIASLKENLELEHISIIPFRDVTLPLFNMHPSGENGQDCTHFCYFPQMWMSIWNHLYRHIVVRSDAFNDTSSSSSNFSGFLQGNLLGRRQHRRKATTPKLRHREKKQRSGD
jgi:hypothetical protein